MKNLKEKLQEMADNSQYNEAGEFFLKETGAELIVKFKEHGLHFNDDKEPRDIYTITIKRNSREYTFDFGQSISNSGFYFMIGKKKYDIDRQYLDSKNLQSIAKRMSWDFNPKYDKIHKPVAPDAYSVLSCLTKYDPGDFENFCADFGYDTDSKKAEKTYNAVFDEWLNMQRLFSNDELEAMSEIS